MRRACPLPLVFLLALGGCGWGDESGQRDPGPEAPGEPAGRGTAVSGAPSGPGSTSDPGSVPLDWQDPEPPEAQALAEQVVSAPWNQDKTTRLQMSITRLVDRTTGLAGRGSALAATEIPLDRRLARLGAKVSETEVTIRLSGSVLFDFDSADLRLDAEETLWEVAAVIQAYPGRRVRIEGHTDSIASDAYNQQLSERRAEAVRSWLVAHGVEKGRLVTVGHGESRPVADNATAAGRQLNRRVEVIIETGG